MKTERMIGILALLQTHGRLTCSYLAKKFEVSVRTIRRDIEDISKAGIPLVTTQGNGGGVALMEGYALDTTLFTRSELAAMLAGVKALDSVSSGAKLGGILAKVGGDAILPLAEDVEIELSSFYKADLTEKIEKIRRAIRENRVITFTYCYPKGEDEKSIEPMKVVYRWSDWYVYGYSPQREDYRLYKLRRLWNLKVTDEVFPPRTMTKPVRYGTHITDHIRVTAHCEEGVRYRFVEEFGHDSVAPDGNGGFLASCFFSSYRDAILWFLSMGDEVTILNPPELAEEMERTIEKMIQNYQT